MDKICVVMVTVPSQDIASLIATPLVQERLAACVNILPGLRSVYRWNDQINDEPEVLMLIKTRMDLVESQLIPRIRQVHPYSEPEIIALPVDTGSTSYLDWILQETAVARR